MDRVRKLELLVRAAEAGSFAKAARSLQLDPSAVSHAIAELEKELRVTLFYRTTRQLRLTEAGEEICRRGSEIIDRLSDLEGAASKAHENLTGTLRLGMSVVISRAVVMPRLPEFMRRHPALRLECLVITQVKDMHASGVDLLLRIGEPPDSGVIARKLVELRFGVYAAPKYLESAGAPATPEDLLRHRCLVHHPPQVNKPWDEWEFERNGERKLIRVPSTLVTDDREGLFVAALAGGGLIRTGVFDPVFITSGRLQKVLGDWSCPDSPGFYAFYRKSSRMSAKIAAFLEFVTEALAAFDPDELTMVRSAKFDSRRSRARG